MISGQFKIPKEQRIQRASKGGLAKKETWKIKFEENLNTLPFEQLTEREKRERILREQNYTCSECRVGQVWNGKELKFELDHIDGDRKNNQRTNLRFVCPNCHSQTPTWKTKNFSGAKVSDEEIIHALKVSESGYKALLYVGLNPHGGNYKRVRNIIKKYNIDLGYTV